MKKIFLSLLAIAATVAMTACNDDNNDDKKGGNGTETPEAPNELAGVMTENRTLDAEIVYHLIGPLIVEDGATLTIPAGTRIEAKKGFGSYILVAQGGKINVNGTETDPVVMTADDENADAGHWGGLVINGKARISGSDNATEKFGSTEISGAYRYGGKVDNDNSGTITYLILEYTGARSSANVEHNGLTLNAVGSGTTIHDIFVVDGADDGIEFFGGAVNVTNLLVVNSDDDMFDFTMGYKGELKNAYGIWEAGFTTTEEDPRGIEADGNQDGLYTTDTPQSNFKVTDVTFDIRIAYVEKPANANDPTDPATIDYQSKSMDDVIKVRRGATATITNALVKGTGHAEDLIDVTDGAGNATTATAISLTTSLTTAADRPINPLSYTADGFSGLVVEAGNMGADTSKFNWTKYTF